MQYELLSNSSVGFLGFLWAHKKSVAFALLVTLLSWTFGLTSFINKANAASLTFVSDTLSDSGISALSNHTLVFHNTTAVTSGQSIVITFPAGFSLAALANVLDFDLATTSDYTLVAGAPAAGQWQATASGQTVTFLSGGGAAVIPANSTTTIKIGTNASFGGAGLNQATNPTAGSYEINIGGSQTDSANTRVMILSKVTVTAIVNTTFTFTVAGINSGVSIAGATTTTATSTATTMPFATTTVGVPNSIAQTLAVTTNARNGFAVTVNADQNLTSATGADIDRFQNDTPPGSPTAWTAPAGTIGSENTYGHEGVTSDDADIVGNPFAGGASYAGDFVNNARLIFSGTGPANGVQQNTSLAHAVYTIQISPLQEAGNDYTQTLTYVATPTF